MKIYTVVKDGQRIGHINEILDHICGVVFWDCGTISLRRLSDLKIATKKDQKEFDRERRKYPWAYERK